MIIYVKNDNPLNVRIWTVRDENNGESIVLGPASFDPEETKGPVTIVASGAGYGRVGYKHSLTDTWSISSFLNEGETVNMY